jgi:hypothetical protein
MLGTPIGRRGECVMKVEPGSESVGVVLLTAIVVVLVIFLVITWVQGDVTNHLGNRQPEPSPAESSAPALAVAAHPALRSSGSTSRPYAAIMSR